jgi:hypothetical protein
MALLHVFELDPSTPQIESGRSDIRNNVMKSPERDRDGKENNEEQSTKPSFIAICQRKPDLMSRPFLHMWNQRVFGAPMLLRVADLEGYSGCDLYDLVAKRMQAYVPPGVLPFLKKDESRRPTPNQDVVTGRTGMRRRTQECYKTSAHAEDTVFGEIPRYGFRLRITQRDGKKCNTSAWYEGCVGSLIPDDDYPTTVADGDTVAIDWHIVVDLSSDSFGRLPPYDSRLDQGKMLNAKRHQTCHTGKNKFGRGSITLEECLKEFSKEEKIPEVRFFGPIVNFGYNYPFDSPSPF